MKYIIEHLEPKLYQWCLLEYKHISKIVGKKNLIFTHLKSSRQRRRLKKYGKVMGKSVYDLFNKSNKLNELDFKKNKALILDHTAKKTLIKNDFKKYKYLIFGGILGDYPAKQRTKKYFAKLIKSKSGIQKRNLGNKQMSTDTAVLVAKLIAKGKKLENIRFQDKIELNIKQGESVLLPFRYVLDKKNKPILPNGLMDLIKRKGF